MTLRLGEQLGGWGEQLLLTRDRDYKETVIKLEQVKLGS